MNLRDHWNTVYTSKSEDQVSWFEPLPAMSVRMLKNAGVTRDSCVIDIGGGESRLVDHLVSEGLDCVAVLDVSAAALAKAKARLGSVAENLMWVESDVAESWTLKPMDVWHDRAVFHFLTDPIARLRYREHLLEVLKPHGAAIIATFAPDGPDKCSGLPVARYSSQTLAAELGPRLQLVESQPYVHTTPWGTTQSFQYSRFVKH